MKLSAMLPKMRKSLNACTLLRSCGRWHCVTSVVAPMKDRFPAAAEQHQCAPEMRHGKAGNIDNGGCTISPVTPGYALIYKLPSQLYELVIYIANMCH